MPNKPYTGTTDGAAKGKRPGTEWLVRALRNRWQFTNLGTWVVRDVRGKPGQLSVHATGRALDAGYMNTVAARNKAVEVAEWLVHNAAPLGIEAVHDYAYGRYGRTWNCKRGKWKTGTATSNAGSVGGRWLHVELTPQMADDATRLNKAWDALPKPDKG